MLPTTIYHTNSQKGIELPILPLTLLEAQTNLKTRLLRTSAALMSDI